MYYQYSWFITLNWILREIENKMHRWSIASMCTPKGNVPKTATVLENILNWLEKLPRGNWATISLLSEQATLLRKPCFFVLGWNYDKNITTCSALICFVENGDTWFYFQHASMDTL